ncbi:MAG: DNA mismatch repair protein MutS, partial [Clostridiales bacterium]|nr:DNA mismatch repair protein MutS [Clostridiales bacterium]
HELCELEGRVHGIKNYHVITKEYNDDIVFLRKIVAGEALHSYGIQVAKLAGVPDSVIERAKQILSGLENTGSKKNAPVEAAPQTVESAADPKLLALQDELRRLNVDKITAIEALVMLDDLKKRYT